MNTYRPKLPKTAPQAIPSKNREIDNKIRSLRSVLLNRYKATKPKPPKPKRLLPPIKKIKKIKNNVISKKKIVRGKKI